MFIQRLNQVTNQLRNELPNSNSLEFYIFKAIIIWCNQFNIPQNTTNNILEWYNQFDEIQIITRHIYQEWKPYEEKETNWRGQVKTSSKMSGLYNLVSSIFARKNINNTELNIIAIIAFSITAIGYFTYIINQPQPQPINTDKTKHYEYNLISTSSQIRSIAKHFLILVVSASTIDFIKSIKIKGSINVNDGEKLYEITKYLWLGSESVLNQNRYNINRYLVSKGEESEYDIHLVYFELKQGDEGFKPNVNTLARHDAFIKLPNLAINFEISPRLKMEAYENFEVYNC